MACFMSLRESLCEDARANQGNTKGLFVVVAYRLSNAVVHASNPLFRLLGMPLIIFYKLIVNWLLCVDIDCHVTAGSGLRVFHGQGLVVNGATILGRDVTLRHNTTIGNKHAGGESPSIGAGVDVGANSVILGGVRIGDGAVVGAGSVVVHDVPSNAVVAGNPARVIRQRSAPA